MKAVDAAVDPVVLPEGSRPRLLDLGLTQFVADPLELVGLGLELPDDDG